jgi:hypothetical protein
MKYMCLIYIDEARHAALPAGERRRLEHEALAYDAKLRASGRCLASDALASARMATTLRPAGGRFSTHDGPYAETQEQLGGFVMLEASDLDEALKLATGLPGARFGGVEVRPVVQVGGA